MSTAQEYYNQYWSEGGFQPWGSLDPDLRALYETHVRGDAHCLDVGCGDGRTSGLWLRERAASYVGVDVSEPAVHEARRLGLDALPIADASDLPFSNESFDVVVCIEVLEHLFQPFEAAVEIRRVLRPGGLLIASVPNIAYWRRRAELALIGRWNPFGDHLSTQKPWRDPHIRFFTPRTAKAMLAEAGFGCTEIGGKGGGFLREFPALRRRAQNASALYRVAERRVPSLFAARLQIVAQRDR
jgi:2-polyprenyl-3-methyl-5-hydroxy-6-metoxy-1,4-benzoquinol methylase